MQTRCRPRSMEDLLLAAHRYDIEALCQMTLTPHIEGLNTKNALSFLFRAAYKIEELREPVVRFVAKSCGSEMSKRKIYGEYKEHPEVLEIVMDP